VWIEWLDERQGEDFGWVRANDAVIAPRTKSAASAPAAGGVRQLLARALDRIDLWQPLWEGDVTLPPDGSLRYRLVVAEFEEYVVDDEQPYDRTPGRKGRRLVFVEHVEMA
jgi:hypothetical protein